MREIISIFCFVTFLSLVPHGLCAVRSEFCKGDNESVIVSLPSLPKAYQVDVECNVVDKNYTIDMKEYYDEAGNRGKIVLTKQTITKHYLYDYTNDEIITWVEGSLDSCRATKLTQSADAKLFGYKQSNSQVHIPSVQNIMKFGSSYNQSYIGKAQVGGVVTEHWRSCQSWSQMKAVYRLDYYFSSAGVWFPSSVRNGEDVSVPLRAEVQGTINGNPIRMFHRVYNFHNFKDTTGQVDDSAFQVPSNLYCQGRRKGKPFPNLQEKAIFTKEVLKPVRQFVYFEKVWFDFSRKLARFDYKLPTGSPTIQILDYNRGIKYTTDTYKERCVVSLIQNGDRLLAPFSGSQIRMLSMKEYLFLEDSSIQYVGQVSERDTLCDVWAGTFKDARRTEFIVEWFFLSSPWHQYIDLVSPKAPLFKVRSRKVGEKTYFTSYNVIQWDEIEPDWSIYSAKSQCYLNHTLTFLITFVASSNEGVLKQTSFEYAKSRIQSVLASKGQIDEARLTHTKMIYHGGKHVYFVCTLLDTAANILVNPNSQFKEAGLNLTEAYTKIKGLVENYESPLLVLTPAGGQQGQLLMHSVEIHQILYEEGKPEPKITTPERTPPPPITTEGIPTPLPVAPTPGPTQPSVPTPKPTHSTTPLRTPPPPITAALTQSTSTTTQSTSTPNTSPQHCTCNCPTATKCPEMTKSAAYQQPETTGAPTNKPSTVTETPRGTTTNKPSTVTETPRETTNTLSSTTSQGDTVTMKMNSSNTTLNTQVGQKQPSTTGFASGTLAGVAIGMFILGVVLGILATIAVQRFGKRNEKESRMSFINSTYTED